ncbi:MAG: tRNA 5-methoxyuridine(34)/uridine 5-oxyacetic acid(34) synthase CmoB, partial [Gammaproteobacteria bacterium]
MITIHDAWKHPELPWLPELVTRHQSVIDRRLGHGDLKRWSEALSSIPETDSSSATLGRAVGLE